MMRAGRLAAAGVFAASLAAGTLADRPPAQPQIEIGGYRVLAVDLHTHSSMWSDGALTPWGLVLEAERQGLDAIAITGHNSVLDGRLGRAFARAASRVIVLQGEEILSDPDYHLIAVGVRERVGFGQRAADAIDAIHRQGGVAIAAHPIREFWRAYDAAALQRLDGAEICHPLIYGREGVQQESELSQREQIFRSVLRQQAAAARSVGVPSRGPLERGRPDLPVRGGANACNTEVTFNRLVQVICLARPRR